jgi:hypothetical protein
MFRSPYSYWDESRRNCFILISILSDLSNSAIKIAAIEEGEAKDG